MKILPVKAEYFHADTEPARQAHMMKLTVSFRNFTNAPKCSFGIALHFAALLRDVHVALKPHMLCITGHEI